jgi:hypothetical protein
MDQTWTVGTEPDSDPFISEVCMFCMKAHIRKQFMSRMIGACSKVNMSFFIFKMLIYEKHYLRNLERK